MPRIVCDKKNCINCKKPVFDENGNFKYGNCKPKSNVLVIRSAKIVDISVEYCINFEPRKRRIKY